MIMLTSTTKKFLSVLFLLVLALVITEALIHEIDKTSFDGCQIIGYERAGRVLIVRLDSELANGSDGACEAAGELIYKICSQGYSVKVSNLDSSFKNLGRISLGDARILADGY